MVEWESFITDFIDNTDRIQASKRNDITRKEANARIKEWLISAKEKTLSPDFASSIEKDLHIINDWEYAMTSILNIIETENMPRNWYVDELKRIMKIVRISNSKYLSSIQDELGGLGSEEDVKQRIYEFDMENVSYNKNFFLGDVVYIYPRIDEFKTRVVRSCDMCSRLIGTGILCTRYSPLLYNKSDGHLYYLKKPIIIASDCAHYFPTDIRTMELMQNNMYACYSENGIDNDNAFPNGSLSNGDLIDYKEFAGKQSFAFKKFKDGSQKKIKQKLENYSLT